MVVFSNPLCPVSFGFLGFLGAVLSRKSALYSDESSVYPGKRDEEDGLLAGSDTECHELSEDKIAQFLENQKQEYYKSIGMVPPRQQQTFETSTTPGTSMIDFTSSRETSYVDDGDDSALATNPSRPAYEAQTYKMNDSDVDPLSPRGTDESLASFDIQLCPPSDHSPECEVLTEPSPQEVRSPRSETIMDTEPQQS